jgi:hypothetical protein
MSVLVSPMTTAVGSDETSRAAPMASMSRSAMTCFRAESTASSGISIDEMI